MEVYRQRAIFLFIVVDELDLVCVVAQVLD